MTDDDELQTYLQILFNRVRIATAVAIIKYKPAGITARAYAQKLQDELNDRLQNDTENVDDKTSRKILETQRGNLISRLWNVLPPEAQTIDEPDFEDSEDELLTPVNLSLETNDIQLDQSMSNNNFASIQSRAYKLLLKMAKVQKQPTRNQLISPMVQCESDLSFIQAIVWLKLAIATMKEIPADLFQQAFKNQWREYGNMELDDFYRIHEEDVTLLQPNCSESYEPIKHDTNRLKNNSHFNMAIDYNQGINENIQDLAFANANFASYRENKSDKIYPMPETRKESLGSTTKPYDNLNDVNKGSRKQERKTADMQNGNGSTKTIPKLSVISDSDNSESEPSQTKKNFTEGGPKMTTFSNTMDSGIDSEKPDAPIYSFLQRDDVARNGSSITDYKKSTTINETLLNRGFESRLRPVAGETVKLLKSILKGKVCGKKCKSVQFKGFTEKTDANFDWISFSQLRRKDCDVDSKNRIVNEDVRDGTETVRRFGFGTKADLDHVNRSVLKATSNNPFSGNKRVHPYGTATSLATRKCNLKRKHDSISGPSHSGLKRSKLEGLTISSASLNYIARSLQTNNLMVKSVKTILKTIEDEEISRCVKKWTDSMEKQAVEAVVGAVDVLEMENGPNNCRKEAVYMIQRIFTGILDSNDFEKIMQWNHHSNTIFEFCNVPKICKATIDFLTSKLKEMIAFASCNEDDNVIESVNCIDRTYIIFSALKVLLGKYREMIPYNEKISLKDKIPDGIELWKRYWTVDQRGGLAVTGENHEANCEKVLDDIAVASVENWPQVAVLARRCLAQLKPQAH